MSKGLEWAFFSPKKAYKWPTGPWKDVPATLIIRKTQIKTTRYHPTLFGMVIIKKRIPRVEEDWKKGNIVPCQWGHELARSLPKTIRRSLKN